MKWLMSVPNRSQIRECKYVRTRVHNLYHIICCIMFILYFCMCMCNFTIVWCSSHLLMQPPTFPFIACDVTHRSWPRGLVALPVTNFMKMHMNADVDGSSSSDKIIIRNILILKDNIISFLKSGFHHKRFYTILVFKKRNIQLYSPVYDFLSMSITYTFGSFANRLSQYFKR